MAIGPHPLIQEGRASHSSAALGTAMITRWIKVGSLEVEGSEMLRGRLECSGVHLGSKLLVDPSYAARRTEHLLAL